MASTSVQRHLRDAERAAAAVLEARRALHHRVQHPRGGPGTLEAPTRGERAADAAARVLGSWRFLGIQTFFLSGWVVLNVVAWSRHWDPYPFILLNLMLSFQAAYSAPVLLMSSNRQGAVDREQAARDRLVNQRAEAEVEQLVSLLHAQIQQGEEILALLQGGSGGAARGTAT